MKTFKLISWELRIALIVAATLTACGPQASRAPADSKKQPATPASNLWDGDSGDDDEDDGGGSSNLPPPYVKMVEHRGYGGFTNTFGPATLTITVGCGKLKIRAYGMNDQRGYNGTQQVYAYSMVGAKIRLREKTGIVKETRMMNNGIFGETITNSGVLDFSAALPQICAGNPSVRQTVTIEIGHYNTNKACLSLYGNAPMCRNSGGFNYAQDPNPSINFEGDPTTLELRIETEDTSAI
jgi:hypothetical protein